MHWLRCCDGRLHGLCFWACSYCEIGLLLWLIHQVCLFVLLCMCILIILLFWPHTCLMLLLCWHYEFGPLLLLIQQKGCCCCSGCLHCLCCCHSTVVRLGLLSFVNLGIWTVNVTVQQTWVFELLHVRVCERCLCHRIGKLSGMGNL